MKTFEYIAESHGFQVSLTIQPNREALWAKAFGVESLDGLFDMTPVEEAIPRFDAAIRRFNAESEELRPLLAADDPVGLRGNRGILIRLRKQMAQQGGTISGAADESEPRETM